jgi:hypothetical protein
MALAILVHNTGVWIEGLIRHWEPRRRFPESRKEVRVSCFVSFFFPYADEHQSRVDGTSPVALIRGAWATQKNFIGITDMPPDAS